VCAGGGKKLEQRADAEQVQVLRVGMRQVQEIVAAAASAGPGAVQPRQAALEESRRATLCFELPREACMERHQRHECGGRNQRPQNRDARPGKRQPYQRGRRGHSSQPPVAKPALAALAQQDGSAALLVQRRINVARFFDHCWLHKDKVISDCPPLPKAWLAGESACPTRLQSGTDAFVCQPPVCSISPLRRKH